MIYQKQCLRDPGILIPTLVTLDQNQTFILKEDAANVLSFMASNGLIANAQKTSLVILNNKTKKNKSEATPPIEVKIGEEIS